MAFGPLNLSERAFWRMTGREFWTRASAQMKTMRARREDEVAVIAQQTAELSVPLVMLASAWGAELPYPAAIDLFDAWTGKAKKEDGGEDSFFTPELEGEEIEIDL